MVTVLDALWRASAYCLHPWVVLWSLLPMLLVSALTLGLGYLYWEAAVDVVRATLDGWALTAALLLWLESLGAQTLRALLAPLIIVALAVPVIVVLTLLLVAVALMPALVSLVARRRFAGLERRRGASPPWCALRAVALSALALLVLAATVPLWLVPPLALVLPLLWAMRGTSLAQRMRHVVIGSIATGFGVVLFYGWWGWHLWLHYGNPVYPFYDHWFAPLRAWTGWQP